jgi:hypothetical protein
MTPFLAMAVVAWTTFFWYSRARAARRLRAVLDTYAERQIRQTRRFSQQRAFS